MGDPLALVPDEDEEDDALAAAAMADPRMDEGPMPPNGMPTPPMLPMLPSPPRNPSEECAGVGDTEGCGVCWSHNER